MTAQPPERGNGNKKDFAEDDEVEIIVVGLMRTGLRSLHRALRCIGYPDIYDQEHIVSTFELWQDVLHNKATKDTYSSIFKGKKVVMGMPSYCFWENILERYPNARVILTVRDEDQWWHSVQNAKAFMDEDLPGAPLQYGYLMRKVERWLVPSYHSFCEVLRFAWATTLGLHALEGGLLNESAARSNYRKHNKYVETMLSGKTVGGKPQLLIYEVNEGWGPLCKFLGKNEPKVEFPQLSHFACIPTGHSDEANGGSSPTVHSNARNVSDLQFEFDEMLEPDTDFGEKMRSELRSGLTIGSVALTLLLLPILAVHMANVVKIPVMVMTLVYIALISSVWSTYLVMNLLVMRVPALVVLPTAMQTLWVAGMLHVCFITYGILKEMLVTRDDIASPVLVLASRFMSTVCGAIMLKLSGQPLSLGAPIQDFAAFALTNEASTWAGYEMLKYVSFPVQVMAKSVKMLPNMVMGRVLRGAQYTAGQYLQATGALVCVAVMHFADESGHQSHGAAKAAGAPDADFWETHGSTAIGVCLLALFFVTDSFTSQWQTTLYEKHPGLSQTQMMLAGNLLGLGVTALSIASRWTKVRASLIFVFSDPDVLARVLSLGTCGALGQFCIYYAIRKLGPLSFTWIMTARQLLSVLISLVWFGHGISVIKLLCIFTVFGIMSFRHLKTGGQQLKKRMTGLLGPVAAKKTD